MPDRAGLEITEAIADWNADVVHREPDHPARLADDALHLGREVPARFEVRSRDQLLEQAVEPRFLGRRRVRLLHVPEMLEPARAGEARAHRGIRRDRTAETAQRGL